MVEAAADDRAVDLAIAEYQAYCAGESHSPVHRVPVAGGWVEYCGAEADAAHWTATWVRAEDQAVTPLAVGTCKQVIEAYHQLDQARARVWDPQHFPRPTALLDGKRHSFRAARGRVLVGIVAAEGSCVLLVALERRLAAVYLSGKTSIVLHVGRIHGFGEVDVDTMLAFHRPRAAPRPRSARTISSSARVHHIRIVDGTPVDTGDGPQLAEVLRNAFDDLARRAAEPVKREKNQRVRGKTRVHYVVSQLHELVIKGCRDLCGRPGQIIAQIQQHIPGFKILPGELADVLRLLRATGTPLVGVVSAYIWHIKLVGLNEPDTEHHQQFCAGTAAICRVNEVPRSTSPPTTHAATAANEARTPRAHKDSPRPNPDAQPVRDETPDASGGGPPRERTVDTAPRPGFMDLLTKAMSATANAHTLPADSAVPPIEGGQTAPPRQPDAAPLLLMLAARLAVAKARDEAAKEMTAAKAAWTLERDALEVRLRAASTEHQDVLARVERLEADAHAAKEAAEVERAELLARVERAEAEAQAAREAALIQRSDLLTRLEKTGGDTRAAMEATTRTAARTVESPAEVISVDTTITDDPPDDGCDATANDPTGSDTRVGRDLEAESVELARLRLHGPLPVSGCCGGWSPAARRPSLGGLPIAAPLGLIACDHRDDDPDGARDDKFVTLTTTQGREARGSLGPRGPPASSG